MVVVVVVVVVVLCIIMTYHYIDYSSSSGRSCYVFHVLITGFRKRVYDRFKGQINQHLLTRHSLTCRSPVTRSQEKYVLTFTVNSKGHSSQI